MARNDGVLAAHRFGLGPTATEVADMEDDPQGWLLAQLDGSPALPPALAAMPPVSENVVDWWSAVIISVAELVRRIRTEYAQLWYREARARIEVGITTEQPFRERLVWFWGNHFTCSGAKAVAIGMAGGHERESIRPHVTGKFKDMLFAAVSHPGMLFYLDNYRSMGSNSVSGGYQNRGLNENLAREVMELHTLGVGAGYSQNDVREFAKMLTGWTFAYRDQENPGEFWFRMGSHEPGPKTVLGKTYEEAGVEEALAILELLAAHPATARHVAFKMARHFIADDPPPAVVDRLAQVFLDTDGDLKEVTRALVQSPEAWDPTLSKLKNPQEYVVAVRRALGHAGDLDDLMQSLSSFGHSPFMASSPAGWPDVEEAWINPDTALRRARFSRHAVSQVSGSLEPLALAEATLGDRATPEMLAMIGSTDARQGRALLLASPVYQRR